MPTGDHPSDALAELPRGARVTLDLRTGESVDAVFLEFDNDLATLSTPEGDRQVRAAEVERILIHTRTPDPE